MKELSVYPVIYDQKVAWGDMDALVMSIMCNIIDILKAHVFYIWKM